MFLLCILFLVFIGYIFVRGYQMSVEQLKDEKLVNFTREYEAIIFGYHTVAVSLYDNVVDIPATREILSTALHDESRRNEMRIKLYDSLLPNYEKFTHYDIRQLHFHFPDNTSFLRFHKPAEFGDDLTHFRSTVRYTNSTGKAASGFEEGRVLNGYRFVFPVFHDLVHVGSVEVSVSMRAVANTLAELYGKPTKFLLSREVAEQKLFSMNGSVYKSWPISDSFLLDFGIRDTGFPEAYLDQREKTELKALLEEFPFEPVLMESLEAGFIVILPIMNFDGKTVAYLLSSVDMEEEQAFFNNLLGALVLLGLMICLLMVLFYYIDRNYKVLGRMASIDSLTNTLSRNALFKQLKIELERNRRYNVPFSIILFDLDNFKKINDVYGHMAGDAVLKRFSMEILNNSRTTDYLGRLGGDEFLLVLPGTKQNGVEITAEHLHEKLNYILYPDVGKVTTSMGVGEIIPLDSSIEHFIDRIDKGLYHSKAEGRNRVTKVSS